MFASLKAPPGAYARFTTYLLALLLALGSTLMLPVTAHG